MLSEHAVDDPLLTCFDMQLAMMGIIPGDYTSQSLHYMYRMVPVMPVAYFGDLPSEICCMPPACLTR